MSLIRSFSWTRQPQVNAGLNPQYATAFACNPAVGVGQQVLNGVNVPVKTPDAKGLVWSLNGTGGVSSSINLGTTNAINIFTDNPGWAMFVLTPTIDASSHALAGKSDVNNNTGWIAWFDTNGALQLNVPCNTTNARANTGNGVLVNGTPAVVILNFNGDVTSSTGFRFWVNGVDQTTSNTAGSGIHPTDATHTLWFGRNAWSGSANDGIGLYNIQAYGRRQLTKTEIIALSNNPWDVFAPSARSMMFPSLGAGPAFNPAWASRANQVSGGYCT